MTSFNQTNIRMHIYARIITSHHAVVIGLESGGGQNIDVASLT